MSAEKKRWRLPTPFRKLSARQGSQSKSEVSRSRVTSVYLSDTTSTSGFIVVSEFDDPLRTQTTQESSYTSYPPWVVSPSPFLPNHIDSYICDLEPTGFHYSSYFGGGGSCNNSAANASWDDDLSQRLGSAYKHIRTLHATVSPEVILSSDPQTRRKQLGVPQHSVLNYPVHSSLDLPNPHTFPPEPTLPKPLTASPEASRELGLRANTDVYPISPHGGFPDTSEPAHGKFRVNIATDTLSQCHTPEAPWNAHAVCTPKPRPFTSKASKLVKRRVERTPFSPFVLPSFRRRVLLRKPAADTTPSMPTHSWQIPLPQIRPPSPLKIDIPLHYTWHDRRTDFNSFPGCHPRIIQVRETHPRRTSGNTEVLASLAWIGTPPTLSGSYTASPQCHPAIPLDCLGMETGVEDDNISDDALIDRLEKVRRTGSAFECVKGVSSPKLSGKAQSPNARGCGNGPLLPSSSLLIPDWPAKSRDELPLITHYKASNSEDAEIWQAVRKTLLCIREIIRTEKKYQEAIKMLLNAQTTTPPPLSMIPYISALVRASETLLRCFLEDPSAWGVSTAFVTSEDELEATMVSWCAVAGAFFADGHDPQSNGLMGKWYFRKSGTTSSPSPSTTRQSPPNTRLTPTLPTISTVSKIKESMDEECSARQYSQTEQERQTTSDPLFKAERSNTHAVTDQLPSRKLSVRDLAIQPVQRVMRYVLLFKDLLDCTPPTSPSRFLVERALEAATRIANHCDRAQRNPAFSYTS